MEHLNNYIKQRKSRNTGIFNDYSIWPFLDDFEGMLLGRISSKDLKNYMNTVDIDSVAVGSRLHRLLNYIKRRLHTETKALLPAWSKDRFWITNGELEKFVVKGSVVPEDWFLGRSNKTKEKVKNTVNNTKRLYIEKISKNTKEAMNNPKTKKLLKKASKKRKGSFFITDGIINKRHKGEIPDGWTKKLTRK